MVVILLLASVSVISGCGSAEPLKGYRYAITKDSLERALIKVIKSNPHIYLDTSAYRVTVKRNPADSTDNTRDTINLSDYHASDSAAIAADYNAYVKFKIKVGNVDDDYVLRYFGDEQYWKDAKTSEIFITSVVDQSGNGIMQGQNENGEFESQAAKNFTRLLETELIDRLDKELNLKHTGHSLSVPVPPKSSN